MRPASLILSVMLLLGSCVPQYEDPGISVVELHQDEAEELIALVRDERGER